MRLREIRRLCDGIKIVEQKLIKYLFCLAGFPVLAVEECIEPEKRRIERIVGDPVAVDCTGFCDKGDPIPVSDHIAGCGDVVRLAEGVRREVRFAQDLICDDSQGRTTFA